MAGKKARCICGTVVRLGKRDSHQPASKRTPRILEPDNLLDVDLLGNEMLGDQLLGGDLRRSGSLPSGPGRAKPMIRKPGHQKPAGPIMPRPNPAKSESKPAKIDRIPTRSETKPDPITGPGPNSRPHRTPPEVPLTVSVSKSASRQRSKRPLFEQSYGDLDEILSGAGDASPLVARPSPVETGEREVSSQISSVSTGPVSVTRKSSTPGFFAALGSATLAFWFGLLVVGARFEPVNWLLLSGFSSHLRSVFFATLGVSEIPTSFRIMFVVLGWLLWGVAVVMILTALTQFVNAFAKLLTDRQPASWSDGMAGALGVSAMFLLVAIVFCQAWFATREHQAFNVYEQPFAAQGERLENITLLREKIDSRNRSFTTTMMIGATVPVAIFALSMLRLFTKPADEP